MDYFGKAEVLTNIASLASDHHGLLIIPIHWLASSHCLLSVTVQKARDPIASEKQIVFIRQLQNTVEVR